MDCQLQFSVFIASCYIAKKGCENEAIVTIEN